MSVAVMNETNRQETTIKHVALGAAASLALIAGAQAADLPVKAKAIQYVKICSLYGAGYYYIPGTDTCIKLSGYTRADANFNGGNYDKPGWDQANAEGTQSRDRDYFTTRVRTELQIDTRTQTEYGVVRTYMNPRFQFDTGAAADTGVLTLDYGFIQFAGFTLGKAVSTFQTPWGSSGGNNATSYLIGSYDNINGITQIAYTWQFGNGVSAQLGVEDNRTINRAQLLNASQGYALSGGLSPSASVGGAAGAQVPILSSNPLAVAALFQGAYPNSYGGNFSPDVTANVRVDQAAFTFQLSGALHVVDANYYSAIGLPATGGGSATTTVEPNGHPDTKVGGAISAGLQLKNLPTGPGDKLSLDGTWSKGATKYIVGGVTGNNFDKFSGSTNFAGSYQSMAVLSLFDAVYTNGSQLELTTAWGFRGAYVHNWTPNWETSVFGSFTKIDYNTNAAAGICANQLAAMGGITGTGQNNGTRAAGANGYSCNPDFAIWQIGTRTAWTPVRNLTFSAEFMYTFLDQNNTGSIALPIPGANNVGSQQAAGAFKPAGTYDYKDQGIWSGNIGVRRTF